MDLTVHAKGNITHDIGTSQKPEILLMDVTYHFKALESEKKGSMVTN